MKPYAESVMSAEQIFQQDNDSKHTAKSVKQWFFNNRMRVMNWSAQLPDLNQIENLWGEIERALNGQKFKKLNDLFNAVQQA